MIDPAKFQEILINRFNNMEQHLINLIIPIKQINELFKDNEQVRRFVEIFSKPLQVNTSLLEKYLKDFNALHMSMDVMVQKLENNDIAHTYAEIKYIGKRLKEIEEKLKEFQEKGITSKVELDVVVDGQRMAKQEIPDVNEAPLRTEDIVLKELFETLTEKEGFILKHRFGFMGCKSKTLKDIGSLMKADRERVRVLEARALTKCRHKTRIGWINELPDSDFKKKVTG